MGLPLPSQSVPYPLPETKVSLNTRCLQFSGLPDVLVPDPSSTSTPYLLLSPDSGCPGLVPIVSPLLRSSPEDPRCFLYKILHSNPVTKVTVSCLDSSTPPHHPSFPPASSDFRLAVLPIAENRPSVPSSLGAPSSPFLCDFGRHRLFLPSPLLTDFKTR